MTKRKLRLNDELSRGGLDTPKFHFDGMPSVTFTRPSSKKTSEKIMRLIYQNKNITIEELALKCKVTQRSLERNIEKLKLNHKIKINGPDKGGAWEII